MSRIEILPVEVITNIFSFMDVKCLIFCGRVSKLWHNLISEPSFWKTLNFENIDYSNINTSICQLVSIHGAKVNSLSTSIFQSSKITNETFVEILSHCPNLTKIDLGCFWDSYNLNVLDFTLSTIPNHIKNLKYLNISHFSNLSGAALAKIVTQCPQLEYLNVSDISIVLPDTETEENIILMDLGKYIPKLKYYNGFNGFSTSHRKALLHSVTLNCKYLEQFYADNVLPIVITNMTASCKNITRLYLPYCKLNDSDIFLISKNYPNLQLFGISSNSLVSDISITELSLRCPNLTFFRTAFCLKITEKSLVQVALNCEKLRFLSLEYVHDLMDSNLLNIISNAHKLKVLELLKCIHITDEVKKTIVTKYIDCNSSKFLALRSTLMHGDEINWENLVAP